MGVSAIQSEDVDVAGARTNQARQILGQAALLGVLADATLRDGPWGIGWALWIAGLAATVILMATRRDVPTGREPWAWLALTVACAAAGAWRDAEILRLVNVLATLVALALFAMSFAGVPARSILSARLRDVLAAWRYAAQDALGGAAALLRREAELQTLVRSHAAERLPALRGVVLTVPLLFIFGALFSSADPAFESLFRIPGIGIDDAASHLIIGGVFAWLSAGWIRGAWMPENRRVPGERPAFVLGVVEITTSLGALNALFALFVGLQVRWLFGGADLVRATTGLSLAQYARRGFFELVWVAALVLPLILLTRAAAADVAAVRRHRTLSLSLLALLAAIMVSALMRMQLYVSHFGLTTDRLYATVFMGWLAIVFVAMTLTVLREWTKPFAAVTVLSGFATLFALNAANPEAIVARAILARGPSAERVDHTYLSSLSGDASAIVARALPAAIPSPETCSAAMRLHGRAASPQQDAQWNWGATRARAEVLEVLTPPVLRRLCGYPRRDKSDSSPITVNGSDPPPRR